MQSPERVTDRGPSAQHSRVVSARRPRLGRTWQDRDWRKPFIGTIPSSAYWTWDPDRASGRATWRSRH